MCVIICKEKYQEKPTKEFLEKAWNCNPQGAGFMYNNNKKVIISKGYMTFKKFWKAARNLPEASAIIYHFRITTHGSEGKEGTHPFPISDNDELLQRKFVETDIGIAHNGIISMTSSYNKENNINSLSDSQLFVRDYLSKINKAKAKWYQDNTWIKIVEQLIGSNNKLAVLDNLGKIYYMNSFTNVGGYMCSNSYFNYSYNYNKYDGYDEYDDYYEKSYSKNYVKGYSSYKVVPYKTGYFLFNYENNECEPISNYDLVEMDKHGMIRVNDIEYPDIEIIGSDGELLEYADLINYYNKEDNKIIKFAR